MQKKPKSKEVEIKYSLFKPNAKAIEEVVFHGTKEQFFAKMQEIVGYIEIHGIPNSQLMFLTDQDGFNKKSPKNQLATDYYNAEAKKAHIPLVEEFDQLGYVGTIVLCPRNCF